MNRQTPEELAHYARACVDILFKFPFGKKEEDGSGRDELEGIAARSDFDLSQHARFSGKPMGVFDDELRAAWAKLPKEKQDELWKRITRTGKNTDEDAGGNAGANPEAGDRRRERSGKGPIHPTRHRAERGRGPLDSGADLQRLFRSHKTDAKGKTETRVVMKFHPRVAPVKVGVMPLLKNKPELVKRRSMSAICCVRG